VAWLFWRDDSQRYSVGASKLTSEEARRIGKAISRIPEFMMQRRGFYPRGGGPRSRAVRPYHVALEDTYIRAHWDEIYALCRLNSLPFNSTGEVINSDGVEGLRVRVADGCNPVLGSLQRALAARHGVSLSRAARESAVLETARELAEVQSARRAVTQIAGPRCALYSITTNQAAMHSSARWTSGKRAHHLVRVLECLIRRLPARRRPQFNLCDHSAFIAEMIASAIRSHFKKIDRVELLRAAAPRKRRIVAIA